MSYNYITNRTSPNKWVGGNTIKSIVIHWYGDPKTNPSAEGVVNHLCDPASKVGAHRVITGTGRRVWHLVDDKDRAWHAMNGNGSTLGLELDPRCRDEDYDVAAEVIADLWRHYGKLPLQKHSDWVATRCPGNYDLARLQREAEAKMGNEPIKPPVAPTKPTPAPVAPKNGFLGARGYLTRGDVGENVRKVNAFFRSTFPAYAPPKIVGNQFGPITQNTVKEFQRRARVEGGVDGNIGPLTYKAMQNHGFKY